MDSGEIGIVYTPLEQGRHLERVFCALMCRCAATERERVREQYIPSGGHRFCLKDKF